MSVDGYIAVTIQYRYHCVNILFLEFVQFFLIVIIITFRNKTDTCYLCVAFFFKLSVNNNELAYGKSLT